MVLLWLLLALMAGFALGKWSVRRYRRDRIAWAQRRLQLKVLSLVPTGNSPFNVCVLGALVATVTQQDDVLAFNSVINTVARPPVNFLLPYAATDKTTLAKVAVLQSQQAGSNTRLGVAVS